MRALSLEREDGAYQDLSYAIKHGLAFVFVLDGVCHGCVLN